MEVKDEVWVQRNGTPILICDMTEEHAKNVLRLVLRRAREKSIEQAIPRMFSDWLMDNLEDLPRQDRAL